jgi:hypothetical protein
VPKKKTDIQTIRVEVVPPEKPNAPRLGYEDAKKLLKRLVEQQVAEILANRDEFLFQPFFERKKIADEIKRLQTVPERYKWSRYYDRWGCLRCNTREVPHCSLGMCSRCHGLIKQRLVALTDKTEVVVPQPEDLEAIALRALLPGETKRHPKK